MYVSGRAKQEDVKVRAVGRFRGSMEGSVLGITHSQEHKNIIIKRVACHKNSIPRRR